MAARRKRRWLAIGGATAAVAIGVWSAVGIAAPANLSGPLFTNAAPQINWTEDAQPGATSYDVARADGTCASSPTFDPPSTNQTSPFTDSPRPPEGIYCYQVTGHGYTTGNADVSASRQVMVDTTAPALQITSPANGALLKGVVPISASAPTDSGSPTVSVTIFVDNVQLATGSVSASANWTSTPDGTHVVKATALDAAGNQATATSTVTVDNTAPAGPDLHFLQDPVAGSPTLIWNAVAGETYHVARTSPAAKAFPLPVTPNWTDPDVLAPGMYTYVVTATDAVGNARDSAPKSVVVNPPSVTAPRSISANSPTNSVPHVAWQPPVSFLVGGWNIYRDGTLLTTLTDPALGSYDDAGLTAQGPHTYAVQAVNGTSSGDLSSLVSVTFDTVAPNLTSVTATPLPSGAISIDWPNAVDPSPGSGLATYVVRRGATPPADTSSGTAVCSLTAPDTGCVDTATKTGTSYGYAVFAVDGAGNTARREAAAKSSDTLPPDTVAGLRVLSSDASYARLGWSVPARKGADADLAGYRVLQLRPGAMAPLNPQDGTIVCRDVDPSAAQCDALHLTKGKKVTFAVYAFDSVPNYSQPALLSMVPRKTDNKPPHKPTKVKLVHKGLRYLLTWVSPRDADLSRFRVTLYTKPPKRPSLGKAVVNGRVLGTTFVLKPRQKVYVTLFALDVSGNFSKVTTYVVAPGATSATTKNKVAKKNAAVTKKPVSNVIPKKTKPPAKKTKPIPVQIS